MTQMIFFWGITFLKFYLNKTNKYQENICKYSLRIYKIRPQLYK